jgi:hypothetical protein
MRDGLDFRRALECCLCPILCPREPFDSRIARAACRAACFSNSPIRVRIVVDPVSLATDASVINVLAGSLWLLLAWTRKVDNRYTSTIFRLIASSRCVNASYWGSISMSRLLSSRMLNSSSVNMFCAHEFVRAL